MSVSITDRRRLHRRRLSLPPSPRQIRASNDVEGSDRRASFISRRSSLLVFQGTPFCNIDCTYCYLPDRDNRSRISIETIGTTCKLLVEDGLVADNPEVLWHAGEPLVLPIEFYERAFATIESELRVSAIRHKIQTNATLLNDRWINLFKTWHVSVGVSLDGPPHIHDHYRLTRSRGPTSERVLAGISRLKHAGLGLSVICVLTRESIGEPEELFAFFESIGVDAVGFNIDEAEGPTSILPMRAGMLS